jgi:predicted outer membrane repeat protein
MQVFCRTAPAPSVSIDPVPEARMSVFSAFTAPGPVFAAPKAGDGGGVFIEGSNINFTMSGGALISGNSAPSSGGGIYLKSGTLTMNGGKISNNTSGWDGGGVNVDTSSAHFTMNGGEITGNFASSGGPGVWVGRAARFTLNNGLINGNIGEQSVVVWHNGTNFEMHGGRISGTVNPDGTRISSGVQVKENAVFTMTAGEISGNRMALTGGGVRVEGGTFNMSGSAVIKGNAVSDTGGGVYVTNYFALNGRFTMSGGTIYGSGASAALRNTAASGGASLYLTPGGSTAKYSDTTDITPGINEGTLYGH